MQDSYIFSCVQYMFEDSFYNMNLDRSMTSIHYSLIALTIILDLL